MCFLGKECCFFSYDVMYQYVADNHADSEIRVIGEYIPGGMSIE